MGSRRNRFAHCHTEEQLAAEWRRAAARLHPDHGGNMADFVAAQAERAERLSQIRSYADHQRRRSEVLRVVGQVGNMLVKVANGQDYASDLQQLLPSEYQNLAPLITQIFKSDNNG